MNQIIPIELGTEKVGKLLKQYALPAIIAMTASSLYNMVDSIFIGQGVGAYAIAALAISFPFMNMAAAFGTLVGVGAATMVSVLLGQKNYQMANKVLGNVLILNTIIGIAFTAITLIFLDPILVFFGASENTIGYAKEYMTIILIGNALSHMYFGLNALLRSSGNPKMAMTATILTVVLNTILDPLFIFVLKMGVSGAAFATILSQMVSFIWLIIVFSDKKRVLHFEKGAFRINKKIAKESLHIGLAPFLMNFVTCFIVILINNQLKRYGGDLAIGAYGIINRIVFVFAMVVMGFNQGMQPIAGYNYGAKNHARVMEVLKKTIVCAVCVMSCGTLICGLFPTMVVSIFTSDKELISYAVEGLRIMMITMPIVGFQMVGSNFFQSLGLANKAIFLSLTRQLIFLIPLLAVLPRFFGTKGVWMSYPLSDIISTIVTAIILANFIKKYKTLSYEI